MITGLVVIVFIALASLAALTAFRGWKGHHPPGAVRPPVPPAPGSLNPLIYPGAGITMDLSESDGSHVLQLHTGDPIDKVVDWYIAQLHPTKNIRIPGSNTVLKADNTTAVITGGDGETNILIKQEANR